MPRRLPIAPRAQPSRRSLPLADEARPADACRPKYAVWEITLACDLACRHCGSRAGKARPDELSTAEALDLVEQMADLGLQEITLIGGEAYLRDDWLDIVRAFRARDVLVSITSGGRGLDRDRVRAAKDAGVLAFSISVDGLRDTHDFLRASAGAFDAAMRAMDAVRDAGLRLTANTQIGRVNLAELPALFDELVRRGIAAWQMQLTAAMGRAADEDELLLEPYQMLELMPMLAELKKIADDARVLFWPGNSIGYYGPHEAFLRSAFPAQQRGSCGAGISTLGVEANGDVKPCPSLPTESYVGGNVRDAKLVDIWERGHRMRFTRDQSEGDLGGFCRTCYYADECRGGCNWMAHVLLGKIGDNPFCHHRALELRARGERERVVRAEAPPGVPFDHGRFTVVREPWPTSS